MSSSQLRWADRALYSAIALWILGLVALPTSVSAQRHASAPWLVTLLLDFPAILLRAVGLKGITSDTAGLTPGIAVLLYGVAGLGFFAISRRASGHPWLEVVRTCLTVLFWLLLLIQALPSAPATPVSGEAARFAVAVLCGLALALPPYPARMLGWIGFCLTSLAICAVLVLGVFSLLWVL